jgi:hypothetical protein
MKTFALMFCAAALLAACGPTAEPPASEAPAASVQEAPAPAPALPPDQITALEAINPCRIPAAAFSAALGISFAEGVAQDGVIPQRRSCGYQAKETRLIVHVTWVDPAQVEGWKKALAMPLAGTITPVAGDPDGALFQLQEDLGTCAFHYVNGNLATELRLMTCDGDLATKAQAALSGLPRR